MSSEPTPTRRPIAAVRVSTVALLGVVAAIAVPLVVAGSVDGHQRQQTLSQAGPVTRIVVEDLDSSVHITGDPAVSGMTGKATLTWHAFTGTRVVKVDQQYADGVLTLTKDCGGGDCGADIDISVPPTVSVRVTTTNAGIHVTNVSGTVDLHDENASITADKLGSGDATMNTSNAAIHASFVGAPKNIWAHTSNKDVRIITDGHTQYYDKASAPNAQTHLDNAQNRYAPNTIDVLTSNDDIDIK